MVHYHKLFQKRLNYFDSDGENNTWILKPINLTI